MASRSSLRRTHAYDELPSAEPSRAEQTRDVYSIKKSKTLEDVNDTLSRNVGTEVPLNTA
jgi:hypothetical protein